MTIDSVCFVSAKILFLECLSLHITRFESVSFFNYIDENAVIYGFTFEKNAPFYTKNQNVVKVHTNIVKYNKFALPCNLNFIQMYEMSLTNYLFFFTGLILVN